MTAIIIMFIIHILYTQTCEIAQVLKRVHTVLYSLQYYCMYSVEYSILYRYSIMYSIIYSVQYSILYSNYPVFEQCTC